MINFFKDFKRVSADFFYLLSVKLGKTDGKKKISETKELVKSPKFKTGLKKEKTIGLLARLSLKDKILFVKQLSLLMKAGIPILSALYIQRKQVKSKTMAKILNKIIFDVENGQYLATAMGRFKKVFGELTINIIAVSEISGTLSDDLSHLALTLKKQQSLKRKIISSSVYPIFIIFATLFITVMLVVFFFPKIIPVLKSINQQLPLTTRILINISDLLKNHGLLILSLLIFLALIIFLLFKIKKLRFWRDNAIVMIPFIKRIVQAYNTANISRTLGLLQNSGVSVVRAFQIASHTTSNLAYKKGLCDIAEALSRGEKISVKMQKFPILFPATMTEMVAVGESTGRLSETFLYVSDIFEEEMDNITKNLSTAVEPILLLLMGILVGFIAVSIITPIYGITQNLKAR